MPVVIQFFKDMSPIRLAIVATTVLAFMILFVLYFSKISSQEMAILYSDLQADDSAKVLQELDNKSVPYQILSDGAVIKIPKDQVVRVRVALAQEGVPGRGSMVGYEIFDKEDSLGTTNFSQNVKMIRALEGELSRTISGFDQIDKARVHLVLPQKEIFSKERVEPRASVVLKLRRDKALGKNEIDAISHLVTTAVPGLDIKNITIVDSKGKSLKLGTKDEESEYNHSKSEEYRVAYENRLKNIIEELVESTVGHGKVKAQVTAEMNFDRVVTNSEIYDPDGSVVRSVQSTDERERTPVGGEESMDVSVANNLPGDAAGEVAVGNFATVEKSDQTTNYEISKTIKNQISESGVIKRLSIGILVDGVYKTDPVSKKEIYAPRTQEELAKIENLVKVAVGFNEERSDKIEVVNMQFTGELEQQGEEEENWLREELPQLFQTIVFAVVVLLVLITVIRPIALKAFEVRKSVELSPITGMAISALAEGAVGIGAMGLQGEALSDAPRPERQMSENIGMKLNDIVTKNTPETVVVLRKWLNENS